MIKINIEVGTTKNNDVYMELHSSKVVGVPAPEASLANQITELIKSFMNHKSAEVPEAKTLSISDDSDFSKELVKRFKA